MTKTADDLFDMALSLRGFMSLEGWHKDEFCLTVLLWTAAHCARSLGLDSEALGRAVTEAYQGILRDESN